MKDCKVFIFFVVVMVVMPMSKFADAWVSQLWKYMENVTSYIHGRCESLHGAAYEYTLLYNLTLKASRFHLVVILQCDEPEKVKSCIVEGEVVPLIWAGSPRGNWSSHAVRSRSPQ